MTFVAQSSTDVADYQYFFSAIVQVAGALIALGIIALTFAHQKLGTQLRKQTIGQVRAGLLALFAVVAAGSAILFLHRETRGIRAERTLCVLAILPTIHYLLWPRLSLKLARWAGRRWWSQRRNIWLSLILLLGVLVANVPSTDKLSSTDLILMLMATASGLLLAVLVIEDVIRAGQAQVVVRWRDAGDGRYDASVVIINGKYRIDDWQVRVQLPASGYTAEFTAPVRVVATGAKAQIFSSEDIGSLQPDDERELLVLKPNQGKPVPANLGWTISGKDVESDSQLVSLMKSFREQNA